MQGLWGSGVDGRWDMICLRSRPCNTPTSLQRLSHGPVHVYTAQFACSSRSFVAGKSPTPQRSDAGVGGLGYERERAKLLYQVSLGVGWSLNLQVKDQQNCP